MNIWGPVRILAGGVSLACLSLSCALAQEPPESERPDRVDEITVTATRQQTTILDVPGTVTVIGREQLDARNVRDTQDLVRYQPGIAVERQTSGTDPSKSFGGFTIRGVSGNRILTQVDGIRVLERITDGTRDVVELPGMKAVELVRGPASVLWGADALGGMVAYRTLDPDDLLIPAGKPWAVRLHTSFDSYDNNFTKTAIVAGQFGPTLQGIVMINQRNANEPTFTRARADGGRYGCPIALRTLPCDRVDPQDVTAWSVLGKLVWRPTSDHEFKLTGEFFDRSTKIDQLYDFGVVSGTGAAQITNGPYAREQVLTRHRISLSHDWRIALPWLENIKWNVSYSPQRRQLDGDRLQTLASGQVRRTLSKLDYEEKFLQADIQFTSRFAFAGSTHLLTYGFQGDHTTTDYFRRDIVTNLATGVTTETRAGGFNFANARTTRADLYLQDEIKLFGDRWTITPGLRFANYEIDPKPDADYVILRPEWTPRKISKSRLIPQIGTIFKFDDSWSIYARYAEGFKMPTAQQLYTSLPFGTQVLVPNPNLRPESVRSYEAGVRWQNERGFLSVGVFHADYKDFIQNFYFVPNTNPQEITYQNLSSVKITGFEIFGQYEIIDDLIASGSLSYQHGTQRAEPGSPKTAFNGASPLTGSFGLRWRIPRYNLEIEGVTLFGAAVTRTTPGQFRPPAYMVFDSYLTWRPTKNWTLRAGVLNIFDARYWTAGVSSSHAATASASVAATNPLELQTQPGRTFRVSLQADF